ncbi:MAG: histidine kinase dimerization/phospho-acceptor domain-containing protein, partial [Pseudomonadota bacterium]
MRFADDATEHAFRHQALERGLEDARVSLVLAAILFIGSAPFDIILIGNGSLTPTVLFCLLVRAVWTICLLVSGLVLRRASARVQYAALLAGWGGSVLVIWLVSAQAPPEAARSYLLLFALPSLASATLVPALSHWQVRAMNAALLSPVAERALSSLPDLSTQGRWDFAFSVFVLLVLVMVALALNRRHDFALRTDFILRGDLVQAREDAMAGEKAKSRFLAAISHDMRTPLNAISGNLALLLKTSDLRAGDRHMLRDA